MYDDTQVDSMNALFPVRQTVDYDSKVRGNYYQRVKLTPVLAADEVYKLLTNSLFPRCIFEKILPVLLVYEFFRCSYYVAEFHLLTIHSTINACKNA